MGIGSNDFGAPNLNKSVTYPNLLVSVADQITELTSSAFVPIREMSVEQQTHLFVELSILAYLTLDDAAKWGTKMGFTRITQLVVDGDLAVTILSNANDIVLSFRGTYDIGNVAQDISYQLIADGDLTGKAHSGFLKAFNQLWKAITPVLVTEKNLWATGHSLGGALASIAAVRAARRVGPDLDGLFTYGQPRIGNALYVSELQTPSYRYVNHFDVVPHLPTPLMGFHHFGTEKYIDSDGWITLPTIGSKLKRFFLRVLNALYNGWEDHNIMNYRAAIVRFNQESANGQR